MALGFNVKATLPMLKNCSMRIFIVLVLVTGAAEARELHSYALVQDDASLLIEGKRVHLYGIYLPDTGRNCNTTIRPVRCGSRGVLALEFKIQGFVHCYPKIRNPDNSMQGVCYVNRGPFDEGEDLAAYLLERGWAVALPNAPFEYHALERIARHNARGVWGFTVDSIIRR
jgi:endonuclease YncB( thermonuclease family)